MQVLIAKILVCRPISTVSVRDQFLFITDGWTIKQAKNYADHLGYEPLYCVNIRRNK